VASGDKSEEALAVASCDGGVATSNYSSIHYLNLGVLIRNT
jgi:hypothetical protein